jgi:AcrR family transcriptional regulator
MPKRDDDYMASRRDEILDAAIACLLRTGLAGLSTTAICKEAGISMGALYTHFATKDDIVVGIAERSAGRRRQALHVETAAELRARLLAMADESQADEAKLATRVDFELLSASITNPAVATYFHPFLENRDLARAIETLKAAGQVGEGIDPEVAAAAIESMLAGFALLSTMGGKYSPQYRQALALLLDSLAP